MHKIIEVSSNIHNYTVEFTDDIFEIKNIIEESNTITILDENVAKLYPQLKSEIIISSTEDAKTLKGAEKLLELISARRANINTKLVAIGGGIMQDLVGFCASVYARGIEYILVPTTLLAQADSCVGGKTSINLNNKKNIIGTFYPPSKIIIYTEFLKTLSNKDFLSGFGEIYKFKILQGKINEFNIEDDIENAILDSLSYKISVLIKDEFDKGERKFLNYGHTFGHALESISNYKIPHGLAVIIGCMISSRIARGLNYNVKDYQTIIDYGVDIIKRSKISVNSEWFDLDSLLEIIKSDKKSTGKLTMVLIDDNPFLENIENYSILRESLKNTYESI